MGLVNFDLAKIFTYIVATYYTIKYFSERQFSYSLCPNLEGIKDALSYKLRRLAIGQNCCACAQARLLELERAAQVLRVLTDLLGRSPSKVRGDVCSLSWSGG